MSGGELPTLLQARDGRMTRELLLHPGDHGLGMTHGSLLADGTTTATCGYCSTGCGLRLHIKDDVAVGLTPETSYPVNLGMACPKGWEALRVLDDDTRATTPLIRTADGSRRAASWDEALRLFCDRFKAIQNEHGDESVAFLSTGQITCEEMAMLGSLAKFGMGWIHGDGNTRQCMATAVAAYKESFGFDAPPYTYADFEQSDCMVFVGANPCIGHPIMWERVLRNPNDPAIITIDPRRTETATASTQHLQLRPKSDLELLYAITHEIIAREWVDQSHVDRCTSGFEDLRRHVEAYSPEAVQSATGIDAAEIRRAAESIGTASAASLWWTMGVNQSYQGTRTAQAILNIALITGNIGRPGAGGGSITGQCNAMGSRLWSNTTNLLGHHKFESAADRQKVAGIMGVDVDRVPSQPSLAYDQILERVREGKIRGLWVIATNPAHSWIDQDDARELLDRLDFLVVQDMYHQTDTAMHADLILPAAGWGEKDGTLINSERRYGLIKKVRQAPGEALSDFRIFRAIAKYWGGCEAFAELDRPETMFEKMKELSRGQLCDITGIEDYAHIDRSSGIQWPCTGVEDSETTERRLFADGVFATEDGKAKLIVDEVSPPPESPDDDYPMWLLTGRGTVSQWHTGTRTSKSPVLRTLYPKDAYVEMHPGDADRMGITNGSAVRLRSRRGTADAVAMVVPTVSPGQMFMPMHYEATNRLTLSHFDPHSRQPSYKDCAVHLEKRDV